MKIRGADERQRPAVHTWKHDLKTSAMFFLVSSRESSSSAITTSSVVCSFRISSSIIFGSSWSSQSSKDCSSVSLSAVLTGFFCYCSLFTFIFKTPIQVNLLHFAGSVPFAANTCRRGIDEPCAAGGRKRPTPFFQHRP